MLKLIYEYHFLTKHLKKEKKFNFETIKNLNQTRSIQFSVSPGLRNKGWSGGSWIALGKIPGSVHINAIRTTNVKPTPKIPSITVSITFFDAKAIVAKELYKRNKKKLLKNI